MGVRFYDDAIAEKIGKWVKDPNLRILKPEETSRLFEMTFDENEDKPLTLPIIAISRDKNIEIVNVQKQPKTFNGFNYKSNKKVSIPIDVIPIKISYQIDIYTRGMVEADEYMRNFVFNFINYPKIVARIPYNNAEIEHISTLYLDTSVTDNSDIKEHLFADQFTRFTLKIYIDDAYLFSLPSLTPVSIELAGDESKEDEFKTGVYVIDPTTKEIIEKG